MAVRAVLVAGLLASLVGCGGGSGATGDTASAAAPGEVTYQRFCISCHASGVSGAPPLGNALAWSPRIGKGDAVLLEHTIEGMPSSGMPPRGMCAACTDQELLDAIHYMTGRSQ